jgi:anti-anti-sigma regulatory factor
MYVKGALLRGATATMRRLVANELNRSPALLVLDLSGVIRIDAEGIDAVVSAAAQAGESDNSL